MSLLPRALLQRSMRQMHRAGSICWCGLPGQDHSKKPLLLLNHMDVVPVDASRWQKQPFGAEIIDGFLWGRGSLDMKSTGVAQLTALIELKKAGIVPPRATLCSCLPAMKRATACMVRPG